MQQGLGGWRSCHKKSLGGEDEETTVTFLAGGVLVVTMAPSSDGTLEEAVIAPGSSISRVSVIKVMQTIVGGDGCGVPWSKLSAGGPMATGNFRVEGTTCTFDVHIKMEHGSVVGFGFESAA
jgi:hypothetical protein